MAETTSVHDWKREMCERNDQRWLLGHTAYKLSNNEEIEHYPYVTTHRGSHKVIPGFFVEDAQQRGFLLISPMGDDWFELYFALVDANHRRQGVLRAMVDELRTRLPSGSIVWLECRANVAPCWAALNFAPASEKGDRRPDDDCEHEFKLVI